jgi:hypothetical protein
VRGGQHGAAPGGDPANNTYAFVPESTSLVAPQAAPDQGEGI